RARARAPGRAIPAANTGTQRQLVRPVGRGLHLRHVSRIARAARRERDRHGGRDAAGLRLDCENPEPGWRLGRKVRQVPQQRLRVTQRDIIVIGASAGGIPVLRRLIADLPPDLPAAVFVTVHLPSWGKSELPRVISPNGGLPALHPSSGQPIEPGYIYVAPPD